MAFPWMVRSAHLPRKLAVKIVVRALSSSSRLGQLQFGALRVPCVLGRSGVRVLKREGDGATPRGRFRLHQVLFRPGAIRPRSALPLSPIRLHDGWCDSPSDRNYNRPVKLPYPASAERLRRDDGLYDIVVVLGYNDVPRVRGRGSAIFMHIARERFEPTEGCVALRASDLRRLLALLPPHAEIDIRI